jgi:hypothetical protein
MVDGGTFATESGTTARKWLGRPPGWKESSASSRSTRASGRCAIGIKCAEQISYYY